MLVDLRRRNYNPGHKSDALEALLRELPSLDAPIKAQPSRRAADPAKQLKAPEAQALITAYTDGATVHELAKRFGITRQTVGFILKRNGMQTRWRRMTEEEIMEK